MFEKINTLLFQEIAIVLMDINYFREQKSKLLRLIELDRHFLLYLDRLLAMFWYFRLFRVIYSGKCLRDKHLNLSRDL